MDNRLKRGFGESFSTVVHKKRQKGGEKWVGGGIGVLKEREKGCGGGGIRGGLESWEKGHLVYTMSLPTLFS